MVVRTLAEVRALFQTSSVPTAQAIADRIPPGPLLLLVLLGSTNDEHGVVDADIPRRAELIVALYRHAVAAGRATLVLTSGGTAPGFSFNPTATPHWVFSDAALMAHGLPEQALLHPGLPALHTVEEALLCRELASHYSARAGCSEIQLIAVTSDWHAARVRHIFGVSVGAHAALPVSCEVLAVSSAWPAEQRLARETHEATALTTLRTDPYGPWLEFLRAQGLEAANRSRRWSRKLEPTDLLALARGGRVSEAVGYGTSADGMLVEETHALAGVEQPVEVAMEACAIAGS